MLICRDPRSMQAWSAGQRADRAPYRLRADDGRPARRPPVALIEAAGGPRRRRRRVDLRQPAAVRPSPTTSTATRARSTTTSSAAAAAGVDAVYAPTAAAMYPPGFQTHVEPGALADAIGGRRPARPLPRRHDGRHQAVRRGAPDVAVFGEKDFQQLAVIRRMVADLDLGVEIVGAPTVREPDGLAMSSRNRRLTTAERAAAVVRRCRLCGSPPMRVAGGERDAASLVALATASHRDASRAPRSSTSRSSIRRRSSPSTPSTGPAVIVVAAWFGDVRLIDNLRCPPDHRPHPLGAIPVAGVLTTRPSSGRRFLGRNRNPECWFRAQAVVSGPAASLTGPGPSPPR